MQMLDFPNEAPVGILPRFFRIFLRFHHTRRDKDARANAQLAADLEFGAVSCTNSARGRC